MNGMKMLSRALLAMTICFAVLTLIAIPQIADAGCATSCDSSDCGDWSPPFCDAGHCRSADPYGVGCANCVCQTSSANPTKCVCK